jgi:uncharacterized membrane protein
MTESLDVVPRKVIAAGRAWRLVVAIVSTVVVLAALSLVELGALAFLAIASSALNHHGL